MSGREESAPINSMRLSPSGLKMALRRVRSAAEGLGETGLLLSMAALTGFWLVYFLDKTSSYYSLSLLVGVLAIVGATVVFREGLLPARRSERWVLGVLSLLASAVSLVSNYATIDFGVMSTLAFFMGVAVFYSTFRLLYCGYCHGEKLLGKVAARPGKVFLCSLAVIAAVDLLYLFSYAYPGSLTTDSVSQVSQILSGSYSNHHPYWHTMLIRASMGLASLFGADLNAQIAAYSIVQLLIMACVFSFAIMTLSELGANRGLLIVAFALFCFMPYNIAYSVTMWKDILFGGVVLLFVTALARCWLSLGKHRALDYLLLFVGAVGFGLLRNNGLYALIVMAIVLFVLCRKRKRASDRAIPPLVAAGLLLAVFMGGPLLGILGVKPTETSEYLSVPCQQVARTVVDGKALSADEEETVSSLLDVNRISELYSPYISDSIKGNLDYEYLNANKGKVLAMYLQLGIEHPDSYAKAWIDETKGYWSGGYRYWIWAPGVQQNDLGISYAPAGGPFGELFGLYLGKAMSSHFLEPFLSIGLWVWLLLLAFFFSVLRGSRVGALVCLPPLLIVGTLLISTPVFSEFRYAYSVFTVLPFASALCLLVSGKGKAAESHPNVQG